MASSQQQYASGPPYRPNYAQMGGLPVIVPDVPICAVLLAFFIVSGATHNLIYRVNMKRGHKFIFSLMIFGFSMARISALTMRIVWANYPTNIQISIAAGILTQAGVLVIFVVNLFFTQRILRAYHPNFGWLMPVRIVFRSLVACVILCLMMVIIATVDSLYTLDTNTRRIERDIQLFAGMFLAVLAFLPTPIVLITVLVPRNNAIEKFGTGRFSTKLALVLFSSFILTVGAAWRVAANWAAPPLTDPQWFDHKAAYYVLNFGIELVVSFTYAAMRVDRLFHIPDGASKAGDYAAFYGPQRVGTANTEWGLSEEGDTSSPGEEEAKERAWRRQARKEMEEEKRPFSARA